MKYLITGGAGFLGLKLTEKLLENSSNKIYIIDNLIKNSQKKNSPKKNIKK